MNILELKQLSKKFGDYAAVDQMSLAVKEGEIFGFLGANGAGKSTTINMISGLLKPSGGDILFLGKDIFKYSKATKMNIGIVPQDLAIYEELNAYENVKFFAGLYGLRGAALRERVEEALTFVGLSDKHKYLPKHFSGGMKQSRNYILQSVKKLNEMGCTIIYTSHYMEEVEEICTRIAIIDHGKVIAEGTKEQLTSIITDTKDVVIELSSGNGISLGDIQELPGVRAAALEENSVKISSDTGVNNLNRLIRYFMDKGIEIRSLQEQAPDLETVFLTLTGRSLRD
ncbi:ABC transporter ATP-binding protein [Bacillus velezensis]|uniref:ABC transporter ATP-binding protein n=1 Tax=Bacillus velezensis TaxID=492670 RepID=UPI003CED718E